MKEMDSKSSKENSLESLEYKPKNFIDDRTKASANQRPRFIRLNQASKLTPNLATDKFKKSYIVSESYSDCIESCNDINTTAPIVNRAHSSNKPSSIEIVPLSSNVNEETSNESFPADGYNGNISGIIKQDISSVKISPLSNSKTKRIKLFRSKQSQPPSSSYKQVNSTSNMCNQTNLFREINDSIDINKEATDTKERNNSNFRSSLRRIFTLSFLRNQNRSDDRTSENVRTKRSESKNVLSNTTKSSKTKRIHRNKQNASSSNFGSPKHSSHANTRVSKGRAPGPTYNQPSAHDRKTGGSSFIQLAMLVEGTNKEKRSFLNEDIKASVQLSEISAQNLIHDESNLDINDGLCIECPVCANQVLESTILVIGRCNHQVCLSCMRRYVTYEINHSRVEITCPSCSELIHPDVIRAILPDEKYILKYEKFMIRRVLAAEPDARWCPAPDCGYVVLANGCASCPKLVCGRERCKTEFCYHCKQEWHPNQTCSAASIQRNKQMLNVYNISDVIEESAQGSPGGKPSKSSQQASRAEEMKQCPVCSSRITKMNDGSCNHMTCSICGTNFCWLCMKEISDLHYFSPSGCTFWGKKRWSRKKKLLWQLGLLVGAPICIVLIAGVAVPAIVVGVPVWAARKLQTRLQHSTLSKTKRNAIITGGILLSIIATPIICVGTLAIAIPALLGYVYAVVPLIICRSARGCLSPNPSLENLNQHMQPINVNEVRNANEGIDSNTSNGQKHLNPSIDETSLYMSNISFETNSIGHVTTVEREDRESVSNAALAGSINSSTVDDLNSIRALNGLVIKR